MNHVEQIKRVLSYLNHEELETLFTDVLELKRQTVELEIQLLDRTQEIEKRIEEIQLTPGEKGDSIQGEPGYTPIKGVDYFDGKDGTNGKDGRSIKGEKGVDGESVTIEDLKTEIATRIKEALPEDLVTGEELDKLLKKKPKSVASLEQRLSSLHALVMRNYGGHGGSGRVPLAYELSPFLNGVTKVFTIPSNTSILQISSSSAPFVFSPAVDFTGGGTTTLTFTAGIDAASMLAAGQTITLLYVPS